MRERKNQEITESYIKEIETIYISSKLCPSIRQLAEAFKISKSAVAKIIGDGDLVKKRKEYQEKILTKAQNSYLKIQEKKTRAITQGVNDIVEEGLKNLSNAIKLREYNLTVGELDKLIRLRQVLIDKPDSITKKTFKLEKPVDEYSLEELEAIERDLSNVVTDVDFEVIDNEEKEDASSK